MLKRTPLYEEHLRLGAKMVPFGGWEMPVSYSGIIEEHVAVRTSAGLFDIGHMGVVDISGEGALPFIQKVASNDASKLATYRAQYSILLNEHGGVIDDILVYRMPEGFMLVLNASNTEKDLVWLQKNLFGKVKIAHRKDMCMLSIQGPKSELILSDVCGITLTPLKHNGFEEAKVLGKHCLISRTGYTGEDGFELFLDVKDVRGFWLLLLEKGKVRGLLPCGLGARDTLRIEAGLPLYGHEYTEEVSPLQAGYGWAVKFEKGAFIGREALLAIKASGIKRRLIGVVLGAGPVPREDFEIFSDEAMAKPAGAVTSGTYSPLLKKPIALGYVAPDVSKEGASVWIGIRGGASPGKTVALPFFKRRS